MFDHLDRSTFWKFKLALASSKKEPLADSIRPSYRPGATTGHVEPFEFIPFRLDSFRFGERCKSRGRARARRSFETVTTCTNDDLRKSELERERGFPGVSSRDPWAPPCSLPGWASGPEAARRHFRPPGKLFALTIC